MKSTVGKTTSSLPVSVIILTKNEEFDLPGCLESVKWSDDVHVYDSMSTDRTVGIARQAGASVIQRPFDDWSTHQNWGLRNIKFKYPWVLYLDADERASQGLVQAISRAVTEPDGNVAYRIRIRYFFLDRWIRHVQTRSHFIRLFRPERVTYDRVVNPVTIVDGSIGDLDGDIDHFPFRKGLSHWISRHNSYSTLEAQHILDREMGRDPLDVRTAFFGTDHQLRKAHQKKLFYRLPFRPLVKFFYLYFARLGFLDGYPGFVYSVLQSIYEYFIVLKVREGLHKMRQVS